MKVLAVCGSLRSDSSNLRLLRALEIKAGNRLEVEIFDGLADLPHFNPDIEFEANSAVTHWRDRLAWADFVAVSCPEYAHGIPGSFKNALDWVVGSNEFYEKRYAILSPSPTSVYAPAQIREVINTMTGRVIEGACISVGLRGKPLSAEEIAESEIAGPALEAAVRAILQV